MYCCVVICVFDMNCLTLTSAWQSSDTCVAVLLCCAAMLICVMLLFALCCAVSSCLPCWVAAPACYPAVVALLLMVLYFVKQFNDDSALL